MKLAESGTTIAHFGVEEITSAMELVRLVEAILQVYERRASINGYRMALHKSPKSHPRQWVDWFRSVLQNIPERYVNPTHGSGWMLQILS